MAPRGGHTRGGHDVEGEHREESPLQEGIYITSRASPGRCYRLVLLDVVGSPTLQEIGTALTLLWRRLDELRRGVMHDLEPTPHDDATLMTDAKLTALLGFGSPLFNRYEGLHRPPGVEPLGEQFFTSLHRVPQGDRGPGEAAFALQLIAATDLAVDRAVVETALLIQAESLPLEIVALYSGFNRDDRRSWLGFYDGINNIAPGQRRMALEVKVNDPPWMRGGTYMAFLRLSLDLSAWRRLSRGEQEILVGREKLTGCPVVSVDASGRPVPLGACPVGVNRPGSDRYINPDPPPVAEQLLRRSHIHRTNPNRDGVDDDENARIFRQGYEFVELLGDRRVRVGLNFVSFQRTLARVTKILTKPSWLGDVEFGGMPDPDPRAFHFSSLVASGYYAVPPKGLPFPGADIF